MIGFEQLGTNVDFLSQEFNTDRVGSIVWTIALRVWFGGTPDWNPLVVHLPWFMHLSRPQQGARFFSLGPWDSSFLRSSQMTLVGAREGPVGGVTWPPEPPVIRCILIKF